MIDGLTHQEHTYLESILLRALKDVNNLCDKPEYDTLGIIKIVIANALERYEDGFKTFEAGVA